MTINYKKIISTLLIFVVAVVTGFAIGKIYLSTIKSGEDSQFTYAELALSNNEIANLYEKSKNNPVTSFDGMQLWQIADYKLSLNDSYKKVMTGYINSSGQGLILKAIKEKKNNVYSYTKISPSLSIAGVKTPEVCSQVVYDFSNKVTTIKKGKITETSKTDPSILAAEFSDKDVTKYREQEYIELFKGLPYQSAMPYVFTNKSAKEEYFSAVRANEDGTFSFDIEIHGHDNIKDPTVCYTQEIYFSSGYSNPSLTWDNVKITVTINPDFTFNSVYYYEKYVIKSEDIPLFGMNGATIEDKFTETFEYGEVNA